MLKDPGRCGRWGVCAIGLGMIWVLMSGDPALASDLAPQGGEVAVPLLQSATAFLANPNVAYLLLVMGLLGIVAELITPGMSLPGIIGVIFVVLSLVGFRQLPTNWVGVLLIAAGIGMFALDLFVAGNALTVGGVFAFLIGSLLLFTPFWVPAAEMPTPRLSPWLTGGVTAGVVAFFLLGLAAAAKAQRAPVAMGKETLAGQRAVVLRSLGPSGIVRLGGEEWSATSLTGLTISEGASVEVVGAEGLMLKVRLVESEVESGTDS